MSATAPGQAPRLRAPGWRDPRLVVGVLLVLASVLAGVRVVAAADRTTPVWAAAATLAPGDAVTAAALRPVRVRLEGGTQGYLPATSPPPGDLVALREVSAGDLLPRSAVGDASSLRVRAVGLPVTGPLPTGLVKGAQVDVWVTLPARQTTSGLSGSSGTSGAATTPATASASGRTPPQRLATSAVVSEVSTERSAFAPGGGATVQVLLDPDALQAALAALASSAEVALVLVPGTAPTGG